jgi:hypothetical protein
VNRFNDYLQVVTTNNYNTVAISVFYSSLEHTIKCSQSVTRHFLVTAPTMVIPLLQGSGPVVKNSRANWLSSKPRLAYILRHRPRRQQLFHRCSPTIALLRICCLAPGKCLPSRCPETALVYPPIFLSLHRTGSTRNNIFMRYSYHTNSRMIMFKFPTTTSRLCF